MEKDLGLLIEDVKLTISELDQISNLKRIALQKGNKGDYQSLSLRGKYLKRKLVSLKKAINKKFKGTYIIAKFIFIRGSQKDTFEQTFTNLTKKEVEDIIAIEATIHQCNLVILEIKEIPTHIRMV